MNLRWVILCHSASVDSRTNNLSLFNLIDEVTVNPPAGANIEGDEKVVIPWAATLVVLTERSNIDEPESGTARVVLQDPDANELGSVSFSPDMEQHKRTRNMINFESFPFVGPGLYEFVVQFQNQAADWETKDHVPLVVKLKENAGEQGAGNGQAAQA